MPTLTMRSTLYGNICRPKISRISILKRTTVLSEAFLSRIADPQERKRMGVAGLTRDEAIDKSTFQAEKAEHAIVLNWCLLNGIECIHAPMHKKSDLPEGWPDLTFLYGDRFLLVEIKINGRKFNEAQKVCHARLANKGIKVLTLDSAQATIVAVKEWLRSLGWKGRMRPDSTIRPSTSSL